VSAQAAVQEATGIAARPHTLGRTIWLTGLPSAGKTTIARALAERLDESGRRVEVLDGDEARQVLTAGLGFSRADRDENVRRIGYVADLLSRNGVDVICAVISPFRGARDEVRDRHAANTPDDRHRFVEVWVSTPVEVCSARDVKGLYARQRSGEISGLTGVDDPYEPPHAAELELRTDELDLSECIDRILGVLQR
jgi:adenylylsulfate kinase